MDVIMYMPLLSDFAMFSKKSQYAVRALLCLAHNQETGTGWLGVRYIATQTAIPEKWLAGIFLELRSAGIIESKRGKYGGYCLSHPSDVVSLAQILDVTEGWKASSLGINQLDGGVCPKGIEEIMDFIGPVIGKLRDARIRILDSTTLAQLLEYRQNKILQAVHG